MKAKNKETFPAVMRGEGEVKRRTDTELDNEES